MQAPTGYVPAANKAGNYVRLRKALYGLKHAPREWNHTLVLFLTEQLGFTQLFSEPLVFFKGAGDDFIAISVDVDDQTIIASSLPPIISKLALANRFGIDDLGETTYTLGLKVLRDSASRRLLLSQRKFIASILERFSKYVLPPCSIPMDPVAGAALSMGQSLDTKSTRDAMAAFPYRQLIEYLMYLMVATRPDLAFSPSKLSKFSKRPLIRLVQ